MKKILFHFFSICLCLVRNKKTRLKWGIALVTLMPLALSCNGQKNNSDSNSNNVTTQDSIAVTCYEPVIDTNNFSDTIQPKK